MPAQGAAQGPGYGIETFPCRACLAGLPAATLPRSREAVNRRERTIGGGRGSQPAIVEADATR
jgi:hypothetical protein